MCDKKTVITVNRKQFFELLGPVAALAKVDLGEVIAGRVDGSGIEFDYLRTGSLTTEDSPVRTVRVHVYDPVVY